jgi:hypothetical protein
VWNNGNPEVTYKETKDSFKLYSLCIALMQWRAVNGSKGSIASLVKRRKEKNSYINNSI